MPKLKLKIVNYFYYYKIQKVLTNKILPKIILIRKRANSKHTTYFSSPLLEKLSSSTAMPQANNVNKSIFTSFSPPLEGLP